MIESQNIERVPPDLPTPPPLLPETYNDLIIVPDQGGGGPPDSDDPDDEDPDKESQPAGDIVINPLDTFWWDENPNDPVNEDE